MKKITYIIVDDERLARAEMKTMMQDFEDFQLLGEAANASEAAQLVSSCNPALMFLDVSMPEKSGFELLTTLTAVPEVVFTTAFEQFALKAFDNNALDYLVKPIRNERLKQTVEKVRAKLSANLNQRHLFVKEGDKIHFIDTASIYLIESIGNYARLYFKDEKVFFKRSLNQLEQTLHAGHFFRINRNQIVNLNFIANVADHPKGRLDITLQNQQSFIVSSRKTPLLKANTMAKK